jgi:hypothetical protein
MYIMTEMRRAAAAATMLLAFGTTQALAGAAGLSEGEVNTGYFGTVAIHGYDPVAYFTMGKPVEGDPSISYRWLGAEWRFANEDHRARFMADPVAYAPQYGGLCADGVAYDTMTVNIDPQLFRIIEGKLYLSYDAGGMAEFEETKGFIAKADANWTHVRKALSAR